MKYLAVGSWSLFLEFREDNLVSMEDTFSYVSEILDDLGYGPDPDLLIGFQMPFTNDSDAVRFFFPGLPFQRTDLDASMISPLFAHYFKSFDDFCNILATDASKTEVLTSIAGCSFTNHFGNRV